MISTAPPPELVAALPKYQLTRMLGEGGFGCVYEARDPRLDRPVAVKYLPALTTGDPEMLDRFRQEGQSLASLGHPHIMSVYELVDDEVSVQGRPVRVCALILEHLAGGTLLDRFRRYGLTMEQSCAAGLAVLSGLAAAHHMGVLHRDVKPANAMFDRFGAVKVTDFGLARIVGGETTMVTKDGRYPVVGTPAYMSPEQARGDRLDARTDVYSAAASLYHMVTGAFPFSTDGGIAQLRARQSAGPPPAPRPPVPPALTGAVMRGLAFDPEERPSSATELAALVAEAATRSFGPGWLDSCGIKVLDLAPDVRRALATPVPVGGTRSMPAPANVTIQPTGVVENRRPPALREVSMAVPVSQLPRARAGRAAHSGRPDRPAVRVPVAAATLAAMVLALVALLWTGRPPAPEPSAEPAQIAVMGARPPDAASADLSQAVEVTGAGAGGGAEAGLQEVRLALSVAGLALGAPTSGTVDVQAGQPWIATLTPPSWVRYVAGGAVRGRVEVIRDGGVVAAQDITINPAQSPFVTAMGTGSILVVLCALAYLESVRRSIVAGHLRRTGTTVAAVVGLPLGVGVWMAAAVFTGHEPVLGAGVTCVLSGAVLAAAGTVLSVRLARGPSRVPAR